MEKQKKKRGRKPKIKNNKPQNKKRGRKPKGGKIIKKNLSYEKSDEKILEPNIILHLKCSTNELSNKFKKSLFDYNPEVNNIEGFNITDKDHDYITEYNPQKKTKTTTKKETNKKNTKKSNKEISEKIKELQKRLHFNSVSDKKSDCFWCTFPFDNPAIHIPARIRQKKIEVYGCFCSPECAVAFLNREHIDSSTKWERYALLNNLYGKALNYTNNIKPSPDPYYTLDKFYGNLSISEYSNLLENNRILLVINKPLTKILPELHEEKNDGVVNCKSFHSKTNDTKEQFYTKKKKNLKKEMLLKNFCSS